MTIQQSSLFDKQPAPWEQDAAFERHVATVVFSTGPEKPFDYLVPDEMRGEVEAGRRLRVPFGAGDRLVTGYCVRVATRDDIRRTLKPVASVVDEQPLISASMLRMTEWMAETYLCPWGTVLEAVLPSGVRGQAGTRETTLLSVPTRVAAKLAELELPKKQAAILRFLATRPQPMSPTQLARATNSTQAPIASLRQKGLVQVERARDEIRDQSEPPLPREPNLALNSDQKAALATISAALRAGQHETVLMHGVTGSGKTEVYIQAIQEVIRFGRQAIVLVPEISLTPQTKQRFRSRFDNVAVLHSHLRDTERHWHWQRIARGEVQVVVGARSAIFAPVPNLGLIVIDEEHETSFKQETAPRYHARDVAIYRAETENVPLLLGSATPSLESWHRAAIGEYRLVDMPTRVLERPLPDVGTIDLRSEFRSRRSRGAVSRQLHQAMEQALRGDGQVILLLNRRGFSTHIQCPACGEVVRCPNCELSLTHHREGEIAICHYCDFQISAPTQCPVCDFVGIHYGGLGTQRLEAEVRARFPDYSCLRMDTDTMQAPGSHEKALAAFRSGDVKILLGTQMIAKGLDFPNVTLVGVINADTALHFPDFRAAERTFQLVTQVAGRTGRGEKGGRVLVQTFSPEHPAIQAALRHDYRGFARQELPIREALQYPPFASMIRLVVRGPEENTAFAFAAEIGLRLNAAAAALDPPARVLGPAPAPIAKLRGKYRFHMQMQGHDRAALREAILAATAGVPVPEEVQWIVDVDPIDML